MNKYNGFEDSEYLNLTGRRKDAIIAELRKKNYSFEDMRLMFGSRYQNLPTNARELDKLLRKVGELEGSTSFEEMNDEARDKKVKTLNKMSSDAFDIYNNLFGKTETAGTNWGDFFTNVLEGTGLYTPEDDEREDDFEYDYEDDDDNKKDDNDKKIGTLGWIGISVGAIGIILGTMYLIRKNK
jgi:hypothetical protein